ncbi:MAG: hypothetical protein M3228_09845 [Actinomycetota bacterium]|nr:hypothetical protein [Actinomycetota bacterium]
MDLKTFVVPGSSVTRLVYMPGARCDVQPRREIGCRRLFGDGVKTADNVQ